MTDESGFDGWDPLSDHYNDKSNSYNSGAGAKMQSAGFGKEDNRGYVLWVHPLDSRYTEDSLKNIFSHYGEVTNVRIIYPRDGNIQTQQVYGFVTFKSQGAATNAVRGFNDSDKFDFKVNFSNSTKGDRNSRNRNNKGNSSRNYNDSGPSNKANRDRAQYSSIDESVSNVNDKDYLNSRTTTCEPDFNFKNKDRSGHSTTNHEPVDNFTSNSRNRSLDQNVDYNRPRDNVKSRPRLPSTGSASTSSSCNFHNRTVAAEYNMETAVVPIKTETPSTTSFIKPRQCCFCSKKTFNVCKECRQNFCHAQCSLDGWRNHTGEECVKVAELIYCETPDSRNTSIDIDRNASLTNNSTPKADSKPVYASDISSPTTEYKEFPNLVRDYTTKGNKSFENTPPKIPKFEPLVDNNYEDNPVKDPAAIDGLQQDQPPAYQQRTLRTHQGMGSDQERNKRDDIDGTSNNYDRNGGKNFRSRGNRDGANGNERGSGDARNFSGDANRSYERKPYDNAADSEKNDGGNRNYSRNSNRDRDGYSGHDRRRNFNDRPDGATKPYRGSYQNDRNDAADTNGDFETDAKSRAGYQNRNNAQGRNGGYPHYNENSINFKGNTSFDRNSRRQMPPPKEVKLFELNKTFNVTIVSIDQATGSCYVRIADNEGIFQNMVKCLNSENLTPLQNYINSTKSLALYENSWHRGVVQTNPLRFYFIDFGVESKVDEQSLRIIPASYLQYHPFASHVMLSNVSREDLSQWLSENKLISIKARNYDQMNKYFEANVVPFEQEVAEARKQSDQEQRSPARLPTTPPAPVPPPAASVSSPAAPIASKPKDTGETLQQGVPSEVIVTFVKSENQFFVALKKPFIDLCERLAAEDVPSLSPLIDIQEGCLAMAQFLGDWYRVKVLSRSPAKVQVSFIDYGNTDICEAKTLKGLPDSYKNIPPMATEAKLYRGTVAAENVTDNALITITPLKIQNDSTWLVAVGDKSKEFSSIIQELQSLSLTSTATQSTPPTTPKPRVNVDLCITFALSKCVVYGVYRSNGKALESVANLAGPFTPIKTAPVLNKIYVKDFEGLWCRARVTNVNPIKIYFIDYGNSEECTIDQLFEIPEELQNNPPPLAVKMVLEKESKEILEYGTFVSVSWDQENDTYLLVRDPTDKNAIDSSDITSTSIVNVVSALGDSNYAVILEENRNVYKYINQEINANLDRLGKPKKININDLCLGIYEDENWHRAKIVNRSPLTVHFLDFGDEMQCSFEQIKEIPASVAKIPPLAFKVKTEEFVVLEEGSEVKITMIEELEHNYWKVATIKDRDRSRVEIISDPKHIEKFTKKKAMASSSSIPTTSSQEIIVIDDDNDRRVTFKSKKERDNKTKMQTSIKEPTEEVPQKSESLVKPFDESSLVLTRLSNIPKNYAKTVTTLSNGVENLSLIEPKRNSTFYDINVPIANHLMDMLLVGDSCILIVHESLSDNEYSGMVICKRLEQIVQLLDQMEETVKNTEPISAKKGDLVLVFVSGINFWNRAYVVSEPTNVDQFYLLILFDIGMMYKSEEVYRLNDEFRDVPQLAVRINIVNFEPIPDDIARLEVLPKNVALIEGDTYQHDKSIYCTELTAFDGNCFEGNLTSTFNNSNIIISHKMQLTKWRPTREEVGLKQVPVMKGDIVKISSVCSTSQYYVIPTEDSISEQRNDFLSSVVEHCKKSKSINGDLKINDIVGVPYMQSYYRAQIIVRTKDSYKVRILDIGNEVTIVNSNCFKPLPDNLKFADCYAVCVQLHNVPCTDFNQEAEIFLKYIVTHEIQFTLEINKSTQLIELISNEEIEKWDMKKGDKMNDLLNKELMPGWKKPDFDFDGKYYMNQLLFEKWTIGSELSLYFVEHLGDNYGIMINRYGDTYSKITQVNLAERLREFAEEVEDSYVPITNELCIAKFFEHQKGQIRGGGRFGHFTSLSPLSMTTQGKRSKELLIVGTVINLSSAEIDSDAISQVRFVQYQPIVDKSRKPASVNEAKPKELNTAETGHFSNSLEKPNLQTNTENDEENSSVPKNYAFSYKVKDRNSGDDFSHTQAHNGQATKGEYRVKLPDGRNQVVTYTADNGGYKANIQYDNDAAHESAQETSNSGVYISKAFSDDFLSSKPAKQTTNFDKDSFDFDSLRKDKQSLFSSGKFGSFNFPSSTRKPASYETTENIDEELFPYSKKLLDDVNYLLQYVTPTIESNNRGKEKISIDFSRGRFLNDDPHFKNKFKTEPSPKDKFQLPANFPYQFTKFEEPKFEKLSFNEPNYDDHTFIEPSLMGQKHEDDKFHRLKFQSPKKEVQNIANQLFSGSQFEELRSSLPSSGEKYFDRSNFETQPIQRTNFKNENSKITNAPESKEHQFDSANFHNLRTNNAPKSAEEIKIGSSGISNFKFDDDSNSKFREPRLKEQPNSDKITPQQNPNFQDAYKLPKFEPTLFENDHFEQAKFDVSKFDPKSFENGNFEQAKYEAPKFDPKSFENGNFEQAKYEVPKFDSKSYENNNFDKSEYKTPKFDAKSFENNNFQQAKYETPNYNHFSNSNDQKFRTVTNNDGNSKPNSVEIPQYIHIHRYEASGEDQTNNARPKELIYYNPLQIPVPNSIAYMEHGSYNFSNPQLSTLTPSYITMTEHPRVKPTDAPARYLDHSNLPELALKLNSFDQSKENYFAPTPQTIQTPVSSVSQETPENYENRPNYNYDANDLNPPALPLASPENFSSSPSYDYDTNKANLFAPPVASKVTPGPPSEDHNNYENTIGGLPPYFDPRAYSGYFDFLPESGEAEPQHEKQSSPEISHNPSSVEHSETPKNELPQYYYDFSTASPSHKYVSSAEIGLSSREEFQPVLDADHIRNTSFLASAYLRPLHKERVYIYHNSLPTISAEENHNFSPTTPFEPKQNHKNDADIQIVKSISSTIPPELLKDFDRQLSSPIFARSDDNSDANSELKQVKVSSESSPRLRSDLVKQLQSALATKAVPYLKTPTQQKRVSR